MTAITVVIPVYNTREEYLRRCLDRFVMDNLDIQVLAVNDGSKKETVNILEEYVGMIPAYTIIHQENKGVSCARNTGIRHAEGEWITFCDADDETDVKTLFKAIQGVSEETDFIYSTFRKIRRNEKEISFPADLTADMYIEKLMCHPNNYGTVWAKLYRRSVLTGKQIYFNEELSYAEDAVFILKYLRECRNIQYTKEIFYIYHFEASQTSRSNDNAIPEYLRSMEAIRKICGDTPEELQNFGSCCNTHLMIILANYVYSHHDSAEAEEMIRTILKDDHMKNSLKNYNQAETSLPQKAVIYALNHQNYNLCEFIFRVYKRIK